MFQNSYLKSTASVFGHPLHPIFVVFPIAFLIGAFITDLVYLNTKLDYWALMSFWLIVSGFVTGLVAAIFGLIDFSTIKEARSRPAGWIHFLGNVIVILLALTNWSMRMGSGEVVVSSTGLFLSLCTTILLFITGWFGGELSYRYKIGVHP